MSTRRDFLAAAGGITLGAALCPDLLVRRPLNRDPLRILILGGTGFLGPAIVNRAVEHGHQLTLFNRGRTAPDLFPDLEHLEGDRYSDLSSLEKAVADGQQWDVVIDTFTYVPKTVTDAMDILLPAMKQFIVISTVSVYASRQEPGMDEEGTLATVDDEVAAKITTHREVGQHYGAMKARVEQAAEARFPGKVTNIRPGLIVGPRDTTGRYSYWPVRGSEGGRMIAPGTGKDFVQIVDVQDLGDFVVQCAEQQTVGVFNAVNPAGKLTMKDIVDSVVRISDNVTEPVWIPSDFLNQNGVRAWQHMPAWFPNDADGFRGAGQLSTERAIKAGLKTSNIDDINRSALEYYTTRSGELLDERGEEFVTTWKKQTRGGLAAEKEQEVLAAWDSQ